MIILEGIFKGLMQWIYGLILEIVEYIANGLLDVFSMDLNYFFRVMPVSRDIVSIAMASGWALLIGNLVFQALKVMVSGLGFEGENPRTLFARTFVFSFLLVVSRQVCEIGLGISGTVIRLLQVPSSVSIPVPKETFFSIGSSWLLVIIIGIVLMWQIVKLFFEIGERYFLVGLLTILSPWAFAMGGSKNTSDIFKGWARMYGSMCFMMVMNVVILKMLLSAMSYMPSSVGAVPWLILCVAIARVGRKIDNVVARIGLNPAITGDGLGRGLPGMLSLMVIRSLVSTATRTMGSQSAGKGAPSGGRSTSYSHGGANRSNSQNTQNTYGTQNQGNQSGTAGTASTGSSGQTAQTGFKTGTAGTPPSSMAGTPSTGTAGMPPSGAAGTLATGTADHTTVRGAPSDTAGTQPANASGQPMSGEKYRAGGLTTAAQREMSTAQKQIATSQSSSRRSSVSKSNLSGSRTVRPSIPGTAGKAGGKQAADQGKASTIHPPIPRSTQANQGAPTDMAGTLRNADGSAQNPSRYSSIPSDQRGPAVSGGAPGTAGTARVNTVNNTRVQQGNMDVNAQNQSSMNVNQSNTQRDSHGSSTRATSVSHGSDAPTIVNNRQSVTSSRDGRNTAPPSSAGRTPSGAPQPARQGGGNQANTGSSRITQQTSPGTAGKAGASRITNQTQAGTAGNAGTPTRPARPGNIGNQPNQGRGPAKINNMGNIPTDPKGKDVKNKDRKGKGGKKYE